MYRKQNFKIIYILQDDYLKKFEENREVHFRLFYKLNENFDFYIVNISNIIKENSASIKNVDGFKYLAPKNVFELSEFLNKSSNLAFVKLPISINFHKIYKCLKLNNVKVISISNLVFAYEVKKKKEFYFTSIVNLPKISKTINYYLYRFFVLLNLYPRVSYHFESDEKRIQFIKNSFISKLQKKLPKFKLNYYDKIIRINSKYYSEIFDKTKNTSEDYIVVCDTPISHPDIRVSDGKISNEVAEKYYQKFFIFLNHIKKTFNKEIIFCGHPKGDYKNFKNFESISNNFKVNYYKTTHYIPKAKFVLFQTSNTINDAIILKKPIIQFYSSLLSGITKNKILDLNSQLGCSLIDIENLDDIDSKLYDKLVNEIINYETYTKKRLIFERNKKDLDQLI